MYVGAVPNPVILVEGIKNLFREKGYEEEVQRFEILMDGPVADPANYTPDGKYIGPLYGYPPLPGGFGGPRGLRRVTRPSCPPTPTTRVMPGVEARTGPLRPPAQRHTLTKVKQGTVAKDVNTVIEPGVDVAADVRAINAGQAQKVGDKFIVNGRTYGVHGGGTLYPESGPGFIRLDRPAFQALGVYNKFGNTEQAASILDKMAKTNPALTPEQRLAALRAWEAGQKGAGP